MARQNQSYVESLAQITTEEGQLAYGIQRYILGVIGTLLWAAVFIYLFTDYKLDMTNRGEIAPVVPITLGFLGSMFWLGSWWANRIHQKITNLRENIETAD